MKTIMRATALFCILSSFRFDLRAQDLAPRAYVITPTRGNAVNLTYSYLQEGCYLMEPYPSRELRRASTYPLLAITAAGSIRGLAGRNPAPTRSHAAHPLSKSDRTQAAFDFLGLVGQRKLASVYPRREPSEVR